MTSLTPSVQAVATLTGGDRRRMFALLDASYDRVSRRRFLADLAWKDEAILLRDPGGEIRGFTTLAFNPKNLHHPGGDILFSGDTIIDPAHWGNTGLVQAFCQRAAEWQSGRGRRLFWMLISKGHRTYLFLPIFAKRFHPHPARAEPALEAIAAAAAAHLFPGAWRPGDGVLHFERSLGQLKPALAAATTRRERSPMVRYFLQRNPGFARGDELVCLTELAEDNLKRAALAGFQKGGAACV